MEILSWDQALLVSGGDGETPPKSSGGEDSGSSGSGDSTASGGEDSGGKTPPEPVTVCGSVAGAGVKGEVCITGNPQDTERNLVDIYEGIVGATSHIIERIASSFAY